MRGILRIGVAALVTAGLVLVPYRADASVPHNPVGHLDSVAYYAKYGALYVGGWAGDPDVGATPVRVHLYVDGRGFAAISTGQARPDVARVFPSLGSKTGFVYYNGGPPGRGKHTLCAYVINQGLGGNTALGCATFTVPDPGALLGHIDSISVDPGNSSKRIVTGWVLDPYDAQTPTPFELVRTAGPSNPSGIYPMATGFSAGLPRADVDRVYPHNGHDHGFSISFDPTSYPLDWVAGSTICIGIDDSNYIPGDVGTPTPYCSTYPG